MRGRFLTRKPDFDYECSGLWNDLVVVIAFPSHETPEDERIRNALIGALEKAQISEFICAEQIAPHLILTPKRYLPKPIPVLRRSLI